MENIITVVHVLAAAGLIGLVLLQHGKGADMGAAFGSGASGSLFGVSGSSNFLSRATSVCVAIFFATSLTLAYFASNRSTGSVVKAPVSTQTEAAEAGANAIDSSAITSELPEVAPASNTADDIPN